MVIIDLITPLMGVTMGFLAFLVIGALSGASSWIFYPGSTSGSKPGKFLVVMLFGFIAAASSSFIGQYTGFFHSGQMLEWLTAIFAACLFGVIYSALAK